MPSFGSFLRGNRSRKPSEKQPTQEQQPDEGKPVIAADAPPPPPYVPSTPSTVVDGAMSIAAALGFKHLKGPEAAIVFQTMGEVLCGGKPYYLRIEKYRGSKSVKPETVRRARHVAQEHGVPVESLLLACSALVLQAYLRRLKHKDRSGGPKTVLREVAACGKSGCLCFDFDCRPNAPKALNSVPEPALALGDTEAAARQEKVKNDTDSKYCFCGHLEATHTLTSKSIEALLKRYCDWTPTSYQSLHHESYQWGPKRELVLIEKCTVCDCPDYDHYKASNCKCRHSLAQHARSTVNDEWDLSWILVEQAYRAFVKTELSRSNITDQNQA